MTRNPILLAGLVGMFTAITPAQAAGNDEIELHIEAIGDAQPQSGKVMFDIEAASDTPEGARRGLESAKADVKRKFADIGIKPEQIEFVDSDPDMVPNVITTVAVPIRPAPAAVAPPARSKSPPPPVVQLQPAPPPPKLKDRKRASVTISLDNLGQIEAVKVKAREFSRTSYRTPTVIYLQRDPAQARDAAVAKAIAQARADADRYAAAMGYRVVRVVRVSNAKPALNLPDLIGFVSTIDRRTGDSERIMATVWAGVAIDFVIAPK